MMLTSYWSAARNKLNFKFAKKWSFNIHCWTDVEVLQHTHTKINWNIYANAVWLTVEMDLVWIFCVQCKISKIHKEKYFTVLNHHLIYWCQKYWQFFFAFLLNFLKKFHNEVNDKYFVKNDAPKKLYILNIVETWAVWKKKLRICLRYVNHFELS